MATLLLVLLMLATQCRDNCVSASKCLCFCTCLCRTWMSIISHEDEKVRQLRHAHIAAEAMCHTG
jgi:hypothetical protein